MRYKIINSLFSLQSPFRVLYHSLRARIASWYYQNPSRSMHIIGVTGTKGKSSTVNMVGDALALSGVQVAVFSTVQLRINNTVELNTLKMTSPDPFDLQKFIQRAKKAGCTTLVLEVSSHALFYKRMYGIDFDIVAVTNISQDHLDLHGDMDHYVNTKVSLFEGLMMYERKEGYKKISIVNLGASYADRFLSQTADVHSTYGVVSGSQIRAHDIVATPHGLSFTIRLASNSLEVHTPLIGTFHVENILCAVAILISCKVSIQDIQKSLGQLKPLKGRMQPIPNNRGLHIFVDYAHTEASLDAILDSAKTLDTPGRIILIFGATGERDISKRPKMGRVADLKADIILLTQDDDYGEDGFSIIKGVSKGITRKEGDGFWIIRDRREAIRTALLIAEEDDVLLFAGKGAEEVMITNSGAIPWNESQIITQILHDLDGQELKS